MEPCELDQLLRIAEREVQGAIPPLLLDLNLRCGTELRIYGSTEGLCCSISGNNDRGKGGGRIMPLHIAHSLNIRLRSFLDTMIIYVGSWAS
ncbi:UNVERIFIED_CONTAM: hypothetical protein Sradi_3282800 [Sesamum radiatum]|uniref:Uncharacterized protein n=1 Tax=Sesamum radiatum TaxID=300843 RepID=A0AAW2R0U2_SESRA